MSKGKIYSDEYFAILPEWVLYAPVSSNAIRLYAVLRRFADKQNTCYPTRKTIAERCQFSPASVDRAVEELKAVGALQVTQRKSNKAIGLAIFTKSLLLTQKGSPPVTIP